MGPVTSFGCSSPLSPRHPGGRHPAQSRPNGCSQLPSQTDRAHRAVGEDSGMLRRSHWGTPRGGGRSLVPSVGHVGAERWLQSLGKSQMLPRKSRTHRFRGRRRDEPGGTELGNCCRENPQWLPSPAAGVGTGTLHLCARRALVWQSIDSTSHQLPAAGSSKMMESGPALLPTSQQTSPASRPARGRCSPWHSVTPAGAAASSQRAPWGFSVTRADWESGCGGTGEPGPPPAPQAAGSG